jgi:integrase
VFSIKPGRPISKDTWNAWHHIALDAVGLNGLRRHDFRHTVAQRLNDNRVGTASIGKALGHAFPYGTTARYTAHADLETIDATLAEVLD